MSQILNCSFLAGTIVGAALILLGLVLFFALLAYVARDCDHD